MELHLFRLTARSAFGTRLRGSTLWGHVCWAIREAEGEEALTRFIDAHDGPAPPLILGDAFPAGFLPRPILPPMPPAIRQALTERAEALRRAAAKRRAEPGARRPKASKVFPSIKQLARMPLVPESHLRHWVSLGPLDEERIVTALMQARVTDQSFPEPVDFQPSLVTHVTLSRASGRALDGQLFTEASLFGGRQPSRADLVQFDLPVGAHGVSPEQIRAWLQVVGLVGYGRDASIGRGHFDVTYEGPMQWGCDAPNAVMALGAFVPAPQDPADGTWEVETHYGRVGNEYASHPPDPPGGLSRTPFKKPLLMFRPGSVFRCPSPPPAFVGRLVRGIYKLPHVVTAALAPVLPLRLAGDASQTSKEAVHA